MLLRYEDLNGNFVWGDDGGFDLRQIKFEYSQVGDQKLFYGRVRGCDDLFWEVGTYIGEEPTQETEKLVRKAIQMCFQIRAARWRADRGFPSPSEEQIIEARRTGNAF